jgi:acyl dehydratase
MAEEKFDPLKEGPRSFAVLLAAMQRARADVGGDEQPAHLRQVA